MKHPNILFLMSDEHRADVIGYEGNTIIKTPVLDKLAESGVVFRNAYTPSPICIPARQCMMAGQYPKTCNCQVFSEDLSPGYMTFARRFSQYAYSTVACGKLHHSGIDQMQGWTVRIGQDMTVTDRYIDDKQEAEFNEYSKPVKYYKWSQEKEIKRAGIGNGPTRTADAYTVQGALDFITKYFADPWYDRELTMKPLLLKVSLLKPHYPYLAGEKKFNYYLNRVKPYINETPLNHQFLSRLRVTPGEDVSEREILRATAAYYAMIDEMDEQFGKIIDALELVGQNIDDWIIVYTSDHGEMLGEHGVWEKQKFYEASARVPLFIRWPKRFKGGSEVYENVNLCDLFATLCDMANIPVPPNLESRSLVKLMEGNSEKWDNESISQFGRDFLMIKRDNLKYQYYGKKMPEVLFDLEKDPKERTNYIENAEYQAVLEKFRQRRVELGFC